jgi:hypothetical protein
MTLRLKRLAEGLLHEVAEATDETRRRGSARNRRGRHAESDEDEEDDEEEEEGNEDDEEEPDSDVADDRGTYQRESMLIPSNNRKNVSLKK